MDCRDAPPVGVLCGIVWTMASPKTSVYDRDAGLAGPAGLSGLAGSGWNPGCSGRAPDTTVGRRRRVDQRGGGQNAVKDLTRRGVGKGRERDREREADDAQNRGGAWVGG